MGRRIPPGVRRRVMSSIRSRDTKPETTLRAALWALGVRGWRCHAPIVGRPDIAFTRWKVAVFVDGVWWHGHPDYMPRGRRGPYWDQKIERNKSRDEKVSTTLRELGWKVLRMWDLDVIADPHASAMRVISALRDRG